ncbi:MAG: hypothetical protein IPH46_07945 [Bacteroidetes bacterium]|nr:hypothetical protein [Bacteroidota bacterium]
MQVITIKAHGQYLLQKNLETDFGAQGDGVFDNSHAFLKAWLFFTNQRDENGNLLVGNAKNVDYPTQSGELIIPYLAGV